MFFTLAYFRRIRSIFAFFCTFLYCHKQRVIYNSVQFTIVPVPPFKLNWCLSANVLFFLLDILIRFGSQPLNQLYQLQTEKQLDCFVECISRKYFLPAFSAVSSKAQLIFCVLLHTITMFTSHVSYRNKKKGVSLKGSTNEREKQSPECRDGRVN